MYTSEPMFYVQTPSHLSRFWSCFQSLNSSFWFASLYKNITIWIYVLCWVTLGWCEFYRSKRSIVGEILKTFHSNVLILNLTSWAAILSVRKFILRKLSSFCAVILRRGARLIKHCGWVLGEIWWIFWKANFMFLSDIFGKHILYFLIDILEVNFMFLIKYFGK